jgi:hypothetical protein
MKATFTIELLEKIYREIGKQRFVPIKEEYAEGWNDAITCVRKIIREFMKKKHASISEEKG